MDIKLNSKIYPLQAILGACYTFIDRAYIFLDGNPDGEIKVSLKGKKRLSEKQFKSLQGEFMNELLHYLLRYRVSKNNEKIREYIIGRALYSALPVSNLVTSGEKLDYQRDPLGLAIPWEEKYGKEKKNAKSKV